MNAFQVEMSTADGTCMWPHAEFWYFYPETFSKLCMRPTLIYTFLACVVIKYRLAVGETKPSVSYTSQYKECPVLNAHGGREVDACLLSQVLFTDGRKGKI